MQEPRRPLFRNFAAPVVAGCGLNVCMIRELLDCGNIGPGIH
jgi:hypothetical protein